MAGRLFGFPVSAGTVRLVGADEDRIVAEATTLLEDSGAYERMARTHNPYEDGKARGRIAEHIEKFLRRPA